MRADSLGRGIISGKGVEDWNSETGAGTEKKSMYSLAPFHLCARAVSWSANAPALLTHTTVPGGVLQIEHTLYQNDSRQKS